MQPTSSEKSLFTLVPVSAPSGLAGAAAAVNSVGASVLRAVDSIKWVDSVVKTVKVDDMEAAVESRQFPPP